LILGFAGGVGSENPGGRISGWFNATKFASDAGLGEQLGQHQLKLLHPTARARGTGAQLSGYAIDDAVRKRWREYGGDPVDGGTVFEAQVGHAAPPACERASARSLFR
jgi:hypothetical protein